MLRHILLAVALTALPIWSASYYTERLDDSKAVYLTRDAFPVKADGVADDSDAIQAAINKVQETTQQGIVFIPEGKYRISKTIYVWPMIRLIGYGASRPVITLGANTPGFQDASKESYMIFFAGGRPGARRGGMPGGAGPQAGRGGRPMGIPGAGRGEDNTPRDAGAGTFYSAMANIDLEIGDGNPGAVAIRSRYAQHCYLAHMDIRIGSGIAGIHEGGNVVEDVNFFGGRYAVLTGTPSPGWQFMFVDTTFEGQREAAIQEHAAGLTMVRPVFRKVPTAVAIEPGQPDDLWIKDGRMEDVSGPAIVISMESAARTEINMENVVCRNVPVFATLRESGKKFAAPGAVYQVKAFSHGLNFADMDAVPQTRDIFETSALTALPAPVKSDLPDLPARKTWVNVKSLGATGDGTTDDTEALRKAIAEHQALYLPSGNYIVTDTLTLKPDTVLIGLHPSSTQIDLVDGTPAFQGVGGPKPVIEAPKGGTNIMIGIGVYTNGINPRAVGVKWMAGKDSLMNDVRLLGGHGTNKIDGSRENPYNNTHTADPELARRWDGQYPSLWVTNGGGGTFFDIWTPSSFSQAGMLVSDTTTPGRIYEMSSEHHVRHEIQLHNVSNWDIYALQTEEERGEGGFALPLEINDSSNITVANMHIYRVISTFQPFPWAIKVANSKNIKLRNIHCYSNSKVSFDITVFDQTNNQEVRQREFAWLTVSGNAPKARAKAVSPVVAPGAKVEKLAGGFYNISGGAIDPAGDYYFVDAHWQRIYKWNAAAKQLSTVRDNPLDPINLAIDKAGNVMVVSYTGNGIVYSFKPGDPNDEVQIIKAQPATARPNATPFLAASDWRLPVNGEKGTAGPRPNQYVSPDGTTYISTGDDFASGAVSWGIKSADVVRGFGLAPAVPGKRFYMTSEAEVRTYSAMVGPDGNLTDVKLFAEQGGEGVTTDADGNVYIAAGHIYVYSPAGKLIDTIEVPERPTQMLFGGKDGQTLFIAARNSLYAVRMKTKGR